MSGVQITPDNAAIVHHVIVSKVEPEDVAQAARARREDPGDGCTCFGGAGIAGVAGGNLDDADWVGAWAPGGGERVMADDIGIPLRAGTQLVVQVHYNLLAGTGTDRSTVRLRLSEAAGRPSSRCRRCCSRPRSSCRAATTAPRACATAPSPSPTSSSGSARTPPPPTSCTCSAARWSRARCRAAPGRSARRPPSGAVAGHMHLLGRAITVDVNKGTAEGPAGARHPDLELRRPGQHPAEEAGRHRPRRHVTVTCTHDQGLRDLLPAFKGTQDRYVAWGEGTTDEMCLGIVLMTKR